MYHYHYSSLTKSFDPSSVGTAFRRQNSKSMVNEYRDRRKPAVETMPSSYRMTSRVIYNAQYHRQHCTLQTFYKFGALRPVQLYRLALAYNLKSIPILFELYNMFFII